MPTRSIAFSLCLTLCMLEVGGNTAFAAGIFRSRTQPSRSQQPSQSYRQRISIGLGTDSSKKKAESDAKSAYDAQFEGIDKPPSAPKAAVEADQARLQLPRLTGRPEDTQAMVTEAIDRTKKRYLTVGEHTPWQIFHGVLALRHEFQLRHNDRLVRGLDWLRDGVTHDGLPLVEKTDLGARCHPFTVPWAFEGHVNQFLAILSLSTLPREYQFRTPAGEIVTMADMVNHAQKSMTGRGEMTWTLWFLTHYLEPDAEWETAAGQYWSMERLVRMEAREKVNGAPCGGTHRLFALSLARNSYLAKHGRLSSSWLEADQQIRKHVAIARSVQNRDGSFSSDWFKGRGYSTDLTTRLKTSGHTLEWLMVALSESQLSERWVQLAVQSVARDVIRSSREPAECGALYHALDALTFYKQRRFPGPQPAQSPTYLVTPSAPPSQMANTSDAPAEFVEPSGAQPIQQTAPTPRVAALPDPGLRTLAGSDASDELVVEDIDVAEADQPKSLPMTNRQPQATGEPTTEPESLVEVEEPISPSLAPNQLVVEEVSPAELSTAAVMPTPDLSAPMTGEPVAGAGTAIPVDAEPLETIIPAVPDGESNPLGELVEETDEAPMTEQEEQLVVTELGEEAAGEPISETSEANESAMAAAEAPEAAEVLTADSPTTEVVGTVETDAPLKAPTLPSTGNEGAGSEATEGTPEEPEVKQIAEEPSGTPQVMRAAPSPLGGLILITVPVIETRPIEVPIVGVGRPASPVKQTSWGWRPTSVPTTR